MASAGQAQAHSSQPTHFSRPSGCRFSWCRPCQRGSVGRGCSGYSSVSTLRNIVEKLTPKPATWGSSSDRKPGLPPFSGVRGSARPTPLSSSGRRTSPPVPSDRPRDSATELLLLNTLDPAGRRGAGTGQGLLPRTAGDDRPLAGQRRHRVAAGERVDLAERPTALGLVPLGPGVDHPGDGAAD